MCWLLTKLGRGAYESGGVWLEVHETATLVLRGNPTTVTLLRRDMSKNKLHFQFIKPIINSLAGVPCILLVRGSAWVGGAPFVLHY